MAANIILLVLLIILFLVLALFSLNLNIVITFYASTEIQKLYQYAISVRSEKRFLELYRITEERRKKPKRCRRRAYGIARIAGIENFCKPD